MKHADINIIADQLTFFPTRKKAIRYSYVHGGEQGCMPPMTYTRLNRAQIVITNTTDGKETQRSSNIGDIMMSGPSRENYALDPVEFSKLYHGDIGGDVMPEQSPRQVAAYRGPEISFIAPWGETMVAKPGDYIVKNLSGSCYRIAKEEFEATYNRLGD